MFYTLTIYSDMLTLIFLTWAAISACSGQFLNCGWVAKLDCTRYPDSIQCGSDGVDYKNRCFFAIATCATKNLHLQGIGTCASITYVPGIYFTTTTTKRAVHQTTHRPTAARTTQRFTTPPPVAITMPTGPTTTRGSIFLGHNVVLDFFCLELAHEACPQDTGRVCGTDGRTYANFCEYEKSRCAHRDLNVAHFGGC